MVFFNIFKVLILGSTRLPFHPSCPFLSILHHNVQFLERIPYFVGSAPVLVGPGSLAHVEDELHEHPGPIGYLPGSDAKHLTGVTRGEMIIFGPGSYEVAHAFDEYVDLSEFASTVNILRRFVEKTIRD